MVEWKSTHGRPKFTGEFNYKAQGLEKPYENGGRNLRTCEKYMRITPSFSSRRKELERRNRKRDERKIWRSRQVLNVSAVESSRFWTGFYLGQLVKAYKVIKIYRTGL